MKFKLTLTLLLCFSPITFFAAQTPYPSKSPLLNNILTGGIAATGAFIGHKAASSDSTNYWKIAGKVTTATAVTALGISGWKLWPFLSFESSNFYKENLEEKQKLSKQLRIYQKNLEQLRINNKLEVDEIRMEKFWLGQHQTEKAINEAKRQILKIELEKQATDRQIEIVNQDIQTIETDKLQLKKECSTEEQKTIESISHFSTYDFVRQTGLFTILAIGLCYFATLNSELNQH